MAKCPECGCLEYTAKEECPACGYMPRYTFDDDDEFDEGIPEETSSEESSSNNNNISDDIFFPLKLAEDPSAEEKIPSTEETFATSDESISSFEEISSENNSLGEVDNDEEPLVFDSESPTEETDTEQLVEHNTDQLVEPDNTFEEILVYEDVVTEKNLEVVEERKENSTEEFIDFEDIVAFKNPDLDKTKGMSESQLNAWFLEKELYQDTPTLEEPSRADKSSFLILIKTLGVVVGSVLIHIFFIYWF